MFLRSFEDNSYSESLESSQPVFKTMFNETQATKIVYQLQPIVKSSVLFLSLIADESSFGASRSLLDFLDMIKIQCSFNKADYTLGLLVSSQELFNSIVALVESSSPPNFSRITIILDRRRPTERTHAKEKQKERRRFIAMLRNTLVYSSMVEEAYVLWIDSDIVKIPSGLLDTMIESKKDIITPACKAGEWIDYDG